MITEENLENKNGIKIKSYVYKGCQDEGSGVARDGNKTYTLDVIKKKIF